MIKAEACPREDVQPLAFVLLFLYCYCLLRPCFSPRFLFEMIYENPEIRGIFPKKGRKKTPHEKRVFKISKQPNKRAVEKRCNANFSILYFQKETRLRIQMSCPSVP